MKSAKRLRGRGRDLASGRTKIPDNYLGASVFYFHGFTFEGPRKGGVMKNFNEWMDDEGFIPLGGTDGEYYECPGCHVWNISSIRELFEERNQKEGRQDEKAERR